MQIIKNEENDKIVIKLEGRLDKLSSPTMEEEIKPEVEKKKDIVFDLKDLQYISSAGLRILLATEKKVKVLYDKNFEGKKVIIHPLRNTASISISFEDLMRFTEHFGHTWQLGDVYKNE